MNHPILNSIINPVSITFLYYFSSSQRLDRDGEDKEFFLTVIAKDSGSQPRQTSCSFRVVVEDVNDNPPVFDQAVSV